MSNNFLPERDRKGRHYFDKTNFFRLFFRLFFDFFQGPGSEETRIIVVNLLQDMGNHHITDKRRFAAHGVLLAVLIDQRKFLLVEKDCLPVPAYQLILPLATEIGRQVVFLGFLLLCHTYYIRLNDRLP